MARHANPEIERKVLEAREKGMTGQKRIAEYAGCSQATVSRILNKIMNKQIMNTTSSSLGKQNQKRGVSQPGMTDVQGKPDADVPAALPHAAQQQAQQPPGEQKAERLHAYRIDRSFEIQRSQPQIESSIEALVGKQYEAMRMENGTWFYDFEYKGRPARVHAGRLNASVALWAVEFSEERGPGVTERLLAKANDDIYPLSVELERAFETRLSKPEIKECHIAFERDEGAMIVTDQGTKRIKMTVEDPLTGEVRFLIDFSHGFPELEFVSRHFGPEDTKKYERIMADYIFNSAVLPSRMESNVAVMSDLLVRTGEKVEAMAEQTALLAEQINTHVPFWAGMVTVANELTSKDKRRQERARKAIEKFRESQRQRRL